MATEYRLLLPNNPTYTTEDPLGLTPDYESDGPFAVYPILKSQILEERNSFDGLSPEELATSLPGTISDLSYTLHKNADQNLQVLKGCLVEHRPSCIAIKHLVGAAFQLQDAFSSGVLTALQPGENRVYSRSALFTLFANQFLGTLPCPSWNDWGGVNLSSWFSDADGIKEPKSSYIKSALDYATAFPAPPGPSNPDASHDASSSQDIRFQLCHCSSLPNMKSNVPLIPLILFEQPQESDFPVLDFEDDREEWHVTYIISSHRLIGHGPSGTQEERILASVPELLPVSTFTPPLENGTALVVTSNDKNGFIPTAAFVGHGRTAKLDPDYHADKYLVSGRVRANTFLFLNATELDTVDATPESLPDFAEGMLEADLLKAYTGFSGVIKSEKGRNHTILATPWGSGAFGGDIRVKLLLLWVAASFAAGSEQGESETRLVFMVKNLVLDVKEDGWSEVLDKIKEGGVRADQLWEALTELRRKGAKDVFAGVRNSLAL